MIRAALATLCVTLLPGCVGTSLEAGETHPADPRAAAPPPPETPPTLRPGFDPNGDVSGEKVPEVPDHQHHHHHHDPGHDQHQHDPGPGDGGTR